MNGPSGNILSVPASLSDELYKDLAETVRCASTPSCASPASCYDGVRPLQGMLQFAQHTGVLPELRGEQWAGEERHVLPSQLPPLGVPAAPGNPFHCALK
jgi:hypothetical protein